MLRKTLLIKKLSPCKKKCVFCSSHEISLSLSHLLTNLINNFYVSFFKKNENFLIKKVLRDFADTESANDMRRSKKKFWLNGIFCLWIFEYKYIQSLLWHEPNILLLSNQKAISIFYINSQENIFHNLKRE